MSKSGITLSFGKRAAMISDNNLQIKFLDDVIIIRTVDKIGFPVDIWRFDKNDLSKNEQIFINNILSMSKSMASDQDKEKDDEK
jgi:hypothetical protein